MKSSARFAVIVLATLVAAAAAHAQSQGPLFVVSPATIVDDASTGVVPWTSPGQAATSDNTYAFAGVGNLTPSHYLKATGFGFSIPPTAVILGIEVNIEKVVLGGAAFDNGVFIVKGGTIGGIDHSEVPGWPMADTVVTYGSSSDLWGQTWTPADINASGFGVVIAAHDSVSGSLARVDAFSIEVFYGLCGDTIVAPNEDCDDGNVANGDCCDSTCQFEASGSPCPDTNLCNGNETCNGAGTCSPGMPLNCNDNDVCTQDTCSPTLGCVNTQGPRSGCRTAGKGLLLIKNNAVDSKDKVVWKWLKGQLTTLGDFGLPTGTTAYTLCVYAGTANAFDATIAGGSSWTALGGGKGYKYKNPSGTSDGIQKALLKVGATGKAKAQVKGKGVNLPDPTLPLNLPVTAQLVNDANSICYTTPMNVIKKNTSTQFKAKQ